MGKKRIIKKSAGGVNRELKSRALSRAPKKKVSEGILRVCATYNNTLVSLTDIAGNVLVWSSAGALGFKGTRKSTPYAASKVSELIAEQAKMMGVRKVGIMVKGIGAGRESAIRSFALKGFDISYVKDVTPLPHNGPRPPKPRRV
ncbi:MAG: 30S ribosomal protein S11 [Candidatus Niyogibacteria bacterium]|jgi:small subunit ribosomal protein S11|nr:30S ribosomal protein S11 [Candidatus Niyogibacteria bacterium]